MPTDIAHSLAMIQSAPWAPMGPPSHPHETITPTDTPMAPMKISETTETARKSHRRPKRYSTARRPFRHSWLFELEFKAPGGVEKPKTQGLNESLGTSIETFEVGILIYLSRIRSL